MKSITETLENLDFLYSFCCELARKGDKTAGLLAIQKKTERKCLITRSGKDAKSS